MTLIYLARPIDQAGGSKDWTDFEDNRISKDLAACGHDVYRPSRAFWAGGCGPEIQSVNGAALAAAAGGVALLPRGVPTLGVPAEIERLLAAGRPVLIVTDIEKSAQVSDWCDRSGGPGALACDPDVRDEVTAGLVWLQRAIVESSIVNRQPERRGAPSRLRFAPVAGRWADSTNTPDSRSLLPSRGYEGDAGLDLYVSEDTKVPAGGFADVPCGVRVDVPGGMWAMITGRSSTLRKRGLLVSTGVIDYGWTGPLFAGVQNLGAAEVLVRAGERVAQLVLLPALAARYVPVWGEIPAKARGESGFGSTGS